MAAALHATTGDLRWIVDLQPGDRRTDPARRVAGDRPGAEVLLRVVFLAGSVVRLLGQHRRADATGRCSASAPPRLPLALSVIGDVRRRREACLLLMASAIFISYPIEADPGGFCRPLLVNRS
jgi:hypothetical protein